MAITKTIIIINNLIIIVNYISDTYTSETDHSCKCSRYCSDRVSEQYLQSDTNW